ncbi:unnamed protein product [Didymodactylos carnosus]|uniref:Ubiquitin carboxyl-terminal hydrolase MINDY n=1 Tax=Didymodactylos carnosus TaxID=1234261 RepID=A0A813RM31_9BILA|nr:unnamed protein product [Didymodactylos carnosus]CAF0786676.1 unnamed protein product [Didymodactylos carnosus]CAF3503707.1 unnamed protein product [Didymodactylos carnosus]CAF3570528.1 unnamed protein product [Didymodactylos carnosus]
MPAIPPGVAVQSAGQEDFSIQPSSDEYSDKEILNLVNYFEISRAELQNRVDSLLAQPILKSKNIDEKAPKLLDDDYIASIGNSLNMNSLRLYSQGDPITLAIASTLRLLSNGTTIHSFSTTWFNSKFIFRDIEDPINYGLVADRTGARGLILCVQSFILRSLLTKKLLSEVKHGSVSVSAEARIDAFVDAITEMLWQAGDRRGATIVVPYGDECFSNYGDHYVPDEFTERLHLFEFVDIEKLRLFVIKCLQYEKPLYGIKERSQIGFLHWSKYEEDEEWNKEIGSMFRTPKYPIWMVCLNKRYAIIFSTNINLLNNWIYENYFQLQIYTGLKKQENPCIIHIDTRNQYPISYYNTYSDIEDDQRTPDIIQLLQSRWAGCIIEDADPHELMTLF